MGLKKRLGAFLLCGVIAFHSVCVYTPPAKAAVLESMLANMLLSTYMTATGISLVPDDKTSERLGQALDDLVDKFIPDYQLEVPDFTKESWYTALAADTVILNTGFVRIGSGAAALLGKFTGWLIDKFGLIGEDGTPVTVPIPVVPGTSTTHSVYGDYVYPTLPTNAPFPYICIVEYEEGDIRSFSTDTPILSVTGKNYFYMSDPYAKWSVVIYRNGAWYFDGYGSVSTCNNNAIIASWLEDGLIWANYDIKDSAGSVVYAGINPVPAEDSENSVLSIILPADYEAAPTVDEQYSMVIDTGLTYEDEQSFIDAILAGAAVGDLSPTYTVEQTTPGDVTVPDEGEDTDDEQAGILDWTKKIWQSVKELPGELMDALTNVFVPSAEYTAALPQMVVDTFDSRSGFLTYPFSVLADFIGRLDDNGDDWIITWPDIDEPFSGGRLISKGQFNVSQFVRSDLMLSNVYSTWMLITKGYLIFLFLELCHRKYKSVVGDRLE